MPLTLTLWRLSLTTDASSSLHPPHPSLLSHHHHQPTQPAGRQGAEELNLELPVTVPVTEFDSGSYYKGQHFFTSEIVMPLWVAMAEIMPQLRPRVADLRGNSERYKAMGER